MDKAIFAVDPQAQTLSITCPIDKEAPSASGKSIMVYTTGIKWTKIPGTSLLVKVVVCRDKRASQIYEEVQDGHLSEEGDEAKS